MRRFLVVVCVSMLSSAVVPAFAIEGGKADNGRHPEVGALLLPLGGARIPICTGTLVAPAVFLTASHCTVVLDELAAGRGLVTFDASTARPGTVRVYSGRAITNPAYKAPLHNDVSAVLLDEAASGIMPAQLPPAGLLDHLKRDGSLHGTRFTVVGYGSRAQQVVPGEGPTFPPTDERRVAIVRFGALTRAMLHEKQRKDEGACYGDSGGPSFLGAGTDERDVVVAVTSTGDTPCGATNIATRVDTPEALAFLRSVSTG